MFPLQRVHAVSNFVVQLTCALVDQILAGMVKSVRIMGHIVHRLIQHMRFNVFTLFHRIQLISE